MPNTTLAAWAATLPAQSLGTSDLQTALTGTNGVIASATSQLSNPKANNTLDFITQLSDLLNQGTQVIAGGSINVQTPVIKDWVRSFPTEYGRFLKTQRRTSPCVLGGSCSTSTFAEPIMMEDLQFRGARSYCAMNRAISEIGSNYSLANTVLANWWGFGIGRVNPRVKLLSPYAVTTPAGAEAFAIPISMGGDLNPVFGPIFPKLPEMVHPLVWVTGDAEVTSQEDYGTYYGPYTCTVTGGCGSPAYQGYRKTYRNMEHVEALAGRSSTAGVTLNRVRLATLAGIIDIQANASLTIEQGVPDPNHPLATGQFFHSSITGGSPPSRSPMLDVGGAPGLVSDAPAAWGGDPPGFLPREASGNYNPWATLFYAPQRTPFNDDRAIVVRDLVKATLGVGVGAHVDIGANLSVDVSATASLNAESKQNLIFREQASFTQQNLLLPGQTPFPGFSTIIQSNVVITPEISRTVTVDPLTIKGSFTIDLWFGTLTFSRTIYKADSIQVAGIGPTVASEAHRIRVGEYSQHTTQHDGLNDGPATYSHRPNGGVELTDTAASTLTNTQFASFPSGSTIASCLASPPTQDMAPPPSTGQKASPPPVMQTCYDGFRPGLAQTPEDAFVTLPEIPLNVCDSTNNVSNINAYVNGMTVTCAPGTSCTITAQKACIQHTLEFLCGGTSQEQPWGQFNASDNTTTNYNVVARLRDPLNPGPTDAQFYSVLNECTQAFADTPRTALNFLSNFISIHACDQNATLLGAKEN